MILRRVIAHFKRQEWTAIFLDFLIVVAGVFIGIQVANWNEARSDRARSADYLGRIHDDLLADAEALTRRKRFLADVAAYARAALAFAEDGAMKEGSAWETLLAYYQASQVWPYQTTSATFNEMSAAGDLGLIDDGALRAALANYYFAGVRPTANLFDITPVYRERVRGSTPSAIQDAIWGSCARSVGVDEFELIACKPGVSEEDARAVIDRFRADVELTEDLRFWSTELRLMNEYLISLDETNARALAARVEEELSQ
jgi:hypothetical protein